MRPSSILGELATARRRESALRTQLNELQTDMQGAVSACDLRGLLEKRSALIGQHLDASRVVARLEREARSYPAPQLSLP